MQKSIETIITELQVQLKEATKQERKYYLKVQKHYPAMATATTYEEYNVAAAKINKKYVIGSAFTGEMPSDSRKHFLNRFWDKEHTREAFHRQGQDNLCRMIAAYQLQVKNLQLAEDKVNALLNK